MSQLPKLKLYHYWRSSSSWRVRWAFALKNIPCEMVHVHLLTGESQSQEYLKRNPMGYVPTLEITREDGSIHRLTESMAIMEWTEELFPIPSLLTGDPYQRSKIRQLAEIINSGTQPIQNLSVQNFYSKDPVLKKKWAQHWIQKGLQAYEYWVSQVAGKFSVGDEITLADLCLIPQCYNAKRFDIDFIPFPTIARVWKETEKTKAYLDSAPEKYQP